MATTQQVMPWIEDHLARDPALRQQVEVQLHAMRLAQELRALREARGLSQKQVASMLGVSQPAIAKIESGGTKNFQIKTLLRLVCALDARITIEITPQARTGPTITLTSPLATSKEQEDINDQVKAL